MGQPIQIRETVVVDDVLLVDADRSLTGQDGEDYDGLVEAQADDTLGARLAARLFELDPDIVHVYVLSNTVSVRRRGGWNDDAVATVTDAIRDFLVFYEENRGATSEATAS